MTKDRLDRLVGALRAARVGVVGDFCLDVYWDLDMTASEPSVETGLPTRPVRAQRYSLGGAGNVVNNLAAMGVGTVRVFGVTGDDPFGWQLRKLLDGVGADREALLVQAQGWNTAAYIKPLRDGGEENRIDFGNFNALSEGIAAELLRRLEAGLRDLDVLIVNQQLRSGLHTEGFRARIKQLMERQPGRTFITDSRHFAGEYTGCVHKLNDLEATRLCGRPFRLGDVISRADAVAAGKALYDRWRKPVFVTCGARGCLVVDGTGLTEVPGLHIIRPTDPVGAGDSMVAGIAAGLAAGYPPADAAAFGNFVAGVTVQKRFQTGTASPDEILAIGSEPDYVYEPERADDARQAEYIPETDIEQVAALPAGMKITHAIFDHDGTISTLRQGWELIMEPMMARAILGDRHASADGALYASVVERVRDFIDRTTGVQTLAQMKGLAEMVREFGLVRPGDILDEHGYKAIYNSALTALVNDRLRRLEAGALDARDFTIKKSVEMLERLRAAGVKLYLASGTDQEDVVRDADRLGYGPIFEGRVYGSVGDIAKDAKRVVLERILSDIGGAGLDRLVTFGDGPVEIRETRKRGGVAVGVASDEIRRFGLNASKRSRLIRAGAHLIVPDFAQADALLSVLRL